jgi:hypothetical protein
MNICERERLIHPREMMAKYGNDHYDIYAVIDVEMFLKW